MSAGVVPAAAQALGDLEEPAKTLATRAQAALLDEHLEGALRSFLQLHALLCPAADRWVAARAAAAGLELGGDPGALPLSSAAGLLGLWRELPDLDCERESVSAALLRHAAAEQDGDGPYALALEAPVLAEQAAWLQARLRAPSRAPLAAGGSPGAPRWPGRPGRGSRVQRGTWTVLERLPAAAGAAADFTTPLGSFQHGDRLTLQWQNPLPGQVAVLAAVGDEHDAELTVLLPQLDSESGPRRHHEIIEVVGELSHVAGASHALLILWVPELVPPRWVQEVLVRRALPPEARVWRYHYEVTRAAPPAS